MPQRLRLDLTQIASWGNLVAAFHRAARGRRYGPAVLRFSASLDRELARLADEVLRESYRPGPLARFEIRDPKRRVIHAAPFRDRVLHHALIGPMEAHLDRSLVFDTWACRRGKGAHAAAARAQDFHRRFEWYGKVDVRSYFDTIRHDTVLELLARRIRGAAVLRLVERIVRSYEVTHGAGLPIGSLTSQHFANVYLDGADRFLLEHEKAAGMARYMDDIVIWGADKEQVRRQVRALAGYLRTERGLTLKDDVQINRTTHVLPFCGFRITRGGFRPSRRRLRRYAAGRERAEQRYTRGDSDGLGLQADYSSALAILAHTDSTGWRRRQLELRPAAFPEEHAP